MNLSLTSRHPSAGRTIDAFCFAVFPFWLMGNSPRLHHRTHIAPTHHTHTHPLARRCVRIGPRGFLGKLVSTNAGAVDVSVAVRQRTQTHQLFGILAVLAAVLGKFFNTHVVVVVVVARKDIRPIRLPLFSGVFGDFPFISSVAYLVGDFFNSIILLLICEAKR